MWSREDNDRFGKPYEYTPKWDKYVERSPDKRPSDSEILRGRVRGRLVQVMKIAHAGYLVMEITELDLETGKVKDVGITWSFTDEEVKFD